MKSTFSLLCFVWGKSRSICCSSPDAYVAKTLLHRIKPWCPYLSSVLLCYFTEMDLPQLSVWLYTIWWYVIVGLSSFTLCIISYWHLWIGSVGGFVPHDYDKIHYTYFRSQKCVCQTSYTETVINWTLCSFLASLFPFLYCLGEKWWWILNWFLCIVLYSGEPVLKYLILYHLYQASKKTHPHPVLSSCYEEGDLKITKNNRLFKNYLLSSFCVCVCFFFIYCW